MLVLRADFAIVDEAYPYVAQRLLTDDSPRLQEALRYMVPPQPVVMHLAFHAALRPYP